MLHVDGGAGGTTYVHFRYSTTIEASDKCPGSGSNRSAIQIIDETDNENEVVFVSYPNAPVFVMGQGYAPAIRKERTAPANAHAVKYEDIKTTLRFTTVDPNNPGAFIVVADQQRGARTCAIGAENSGLAIKNTLSGKIYFDSGNIQAYGGYDRLSILDSGVAIGADAFTRVEGLFFTGVNVYAESKGGGAAAIGTSRSYSFLASADMDYPVKNIQITGGRVEAKVVDAPGGYGFAAAIGGGHSSSCDGIHIKGGEVIATNEAGGAAIGGGYDAKALNIDISGGNVIASARLSVAIGSSGVTEEYTAWLKNSDVGKTTVNISGGTVKAIGGKAGIGGGISSDTYKGNRGSITISGGNVSATATGYSSDGVAIGATARLDSVLIKGGTINAVNITRKGAAIGSMDGAMLKDNITITGGTIITDCIHAPRDIGGYTNTLSKNETPIYISGGNIRAEKLNVDPYNQANDPKQKVYLQKIGIYPQNQLVQDTAAVNVEGLSFAPNIGYPYGLNDVHVFPTKYAREDYGALWFYLPNDSRVRDATVDAEIIAGNPAKTLRKREEDSGKQYMLYAPTKVTLKDEGQDDIVAVAYLDDATITPTLPVHTQSGKELLGYWASADDRGDWIIRPDGYFNPNGWSDNGTELVNSGGKWAAAIPEVSVFARWKPSTYQIAFDANVPHNASTKANISGEMIDTAVQADGQTTLPANSYQLPGYDFDGWNTQPDGNGTAYADGATVNGANLEGNITLYAQWKAKTYTITFECEDYTVEGAHSQPLTFDKPEKLFKNEWQNSVLNFVGWAEKAFGSSLHKDEDEVCNLCNINSDGSITGKTLIAVWTKDSSNSITIWVTNDDKPVSGLKDKLELKQEGGVYGRSFFREDPADSGRYLIGGKQAPPEGTHDIVLDGFDTDGMTVELGGTAVLEYYSVEVKPADAHLDAWVIDSETTLPTYTRLDYNRAGTNLEIRAEVRSDGYRFERYTAIGKEPSVWDPSIANQTITMAGQVLLEAHAVPIRYKVAFDPNGGVGFMPVQDMVYDEPQNLFKCTFSKQGHTFAGWSYTPVLQAESDLILDNASVCSMTTTDSAVVTLYAQWNAEPYFVHYDSNGGVHEMMEQKMFFGQAAQLSKNAFTRDEHHFIGWGVQPYSDKADFADEETVDLSQALNMTAAKDVTLYALWERDTYQIAYDANGGTGTMPVQTANVGRLAVIEDSSFAKTDYQFESWNTLPNGYGTTYLPGDVVMDMADANETITLYAQWSKVDVPLTGDSSRPWLWLALGGLSLVLGLWAWRKKKA